MFTGIITDVGEIVAVEPRVQGQLHRLRVRCGYDRATIADGASIAHNGVCLTVVESHALAGGTEYAVDAAAETMRLTTAQEWGVGTRLNLERALRIGDELGGHIVTRHVDGITDVVSRTDLPGMARFELRAPRDLARFIAAKGSVALDGVSLTVNTAVDDVFSVLIIPHTLRVTTLDGWKPGSRVNLEIDLMARYAARLTEMK